MGCNLSRLEADGDFLVATESAMTLGKRRDTTSKKDNEREQADGLQEEEIHGVEKVKVVLRTPIGKDEEKEKCHCDRTIPKKRRSSLAGDHNGHLPHLQDEENFGSPSFRIYFADNSPNAMGSSDKPSSDRDDEIIAAVCRKKNSEAQESIVITISEESSEPKAETRVVKPRRFGSLAKRRSIYAIIKSRYTGSVHVHPHVTNSE